MFKSIKAGINIFRTIVAEVVAPGDCAVVDSQQLDGLVAHVIRSNADRAILARIEDELAKLKAPEGTSDAEETAEFPSDARHRFQVMSGIVGQPVNFTGWPVLTGDAAEQLGTDLMSSFFEKIETERKQQIDSAIEFILKNADREHLQRLAGIIAGPQPTAPVDPVAESVKLVRDPKVRQMIYEDFPGASNGAGASHPDDDKMPF